MDDYDKYISGDKLPDDYNELKKKYYERTGYVAGVSDDIKPPLYSPEKTEL